MNPPNLPDLGHTTVRQLALKLGISNQMVGLLVKDGYVRIVHSHYQWGRTVITNPPRHLLRWLKTMYRPIHERPIIRIDEIAKITGASKATVKRWLRRAGIKYELTLSHDEVISAFELELFAQQLPNLKTVRFDRISILQYLCQEQLGEWMPDKVIPYSMSLEREIKKIARMEEPQRTFRATELWGAFLDARTVAEGLRDYRYKLEREEVKRADRWLTELMNKLDGSEERGSEARRLAYESQSACQVSPQSEADNRNPPGLDDHDD